MKERVRALANLLHGGVLYPIGAEFDTSEAAALEARGFVRRQKQEPKKEEIIKDEPKPTTRAPKKGKK